MAVINSQEVDGVSIASRFRKARDASGMTRKQVAQKAGISVKTLEKIENNQQEPTISRALALCEVLGVPISEIREELGGQPGHAADDHGGDVSPVMLARRKIQEAAEAMGGRVVFSDMGDPGAVAGGVQGDTPAENDQPDMSIDATVRELRTVARQHDLSARSVTQSVRQVLNELKAADVPRLLDVAQDNGVAFRRFEDMPEDRENADESRLTALQSHIIVAAVYGVPLDQLNQRGIGMLQEALVDNEDVGDEVVEKALKGEPRRDQEAWLNFKRDRLAPLVVDALLRGLPVNLEKIARKKGVFHGGGLT